MTFFSAMPTQIMAFLQESSFICTRIIKGSMAHPHEMVSSTDSGGRTPGQTSFNEVKVLLKYVDVFVTYTILREVYLNSIMSCS